MAAAFTLQSLGVASPLASLHAGEALAAAAREDTSLLVRSAAAEALLSLSSPQVSISEPADSLSALTAAAGHQEDWGDGELDDEFLPM